jgi:NAD(P)-dependent dehydrogenase (short-subunit alcohol dehydrogenase family)
MSTLETKNLTGRHAVITGGGRGIGAAIADSLNELGAKITLMGRTEPTLRNKCEELNQAQAVTVDVCDEKSVQKAFEQARNSFGTIDILINNAGAAYASPLHRTDTENWKYMLDVNLSGVFYGCREVVEDMSKSKWGRIINIASIAGLAGAPYISAYCAAKHGVVGLTRALALELAKMDITVNAICPGYTNTELLDGAIDNILNKTSLSREEAIESLKSTSPQQ